MKHIFVGVILSLFPVFLKSQASMNTAHIIIKADSVASDELKKFDDNRGRETGVPLALQHFNKTVSFNEDKSRAYVTYVFDKVKFYGASGSKIKINNEDKFPYHFGVMVETSSGKAAIFK